MRLDTYLVSVMSSSGCVSPAGPCAVSGDGGRGNGRTLLLWMMTGKIDCRPQQLGCPGGPHGTCQRRIFPEHCWKRPHPFREVQICESHGCCSSYCSGRCQTLAFRLTRVWLRLSLREDIGKVESFECKV